MSRVQLLTKKNTTNNVEGKKRHILIIGATGITGRATVEHFIKLGNWNVTCCSRRTPTYDLMGAKHVTLDLQNKEDCIVKTKEYFTSVTHAMYGAVYELGNYEDGGVVMGWRNKKQIQTNGEMFENFLTPLLQYAPNFVHLSFMQGGKAYGAHVLGVNPLAVPCKEDAPRVVNENFYWLHEDFAKDCVKKSNGKFSYTIWRPPFIAGIALASPLNPITAMIVHAFIKRELGEPLSYPGRERYVTELMDSRLLAKAIEWAANHSHDAAKNETFNINNGDTVVLEGAYVKLANHLNMPVAEPKMVELSNIMKDEKYDKVWQEMVKKYGLQNLSLAEIVGQSWESFDAFVHSMGSSKRTLPTTQRMFAGQMMSTIKLRQHGFHDMIDSEQMLLRWVDELREQNIVPAN